MINYKIMELYQPFIKQTIKNMISSMVFKLKRLMHGFPTFLSKHNTVDFDNNNANGYTQTHKTFRFLKVQFAQKYFA